MTPYVCTICVEPVVKDETGFAHEGTGPFDHEATLRNTPLSNHPMIGETITYRPHHEDMTDLPITPGTVCRNGDRVEVRAVFHNWNGIKDLTIFYVFVPATGMHTHLSESECGILEGTY